MQITKLENPREKPNPTMRQPERSVIPRGSNAFAPMSEIIPAVMNRIVNEWQAEDRSVGAELLRATLSDKSGVNSQGKGIAGKLEAAGQPKKTT